MHKLRTLVGLPGWQRILLGEIAFLLALIPWILRLRTLPQAVSLLVALTRWLPTARSPVSLQSLVALVRVASRYSLLPVSCLERALVLQAVLRHYGFSSELQIGVSRTDRLLQAHAWLEHQGTPIGEPADPVAAFRPLSSPGLTSGLSPQRPTPLP
jgi:hypothetical protein